MFVLIFKDLRVFDINQRRNANEFVIYLKKKENKKKKKKMDYCEENGEPS